MTINDINQEINKILEYEINKTIKFYGLENIMEEFLDTLQSVTKEGQRDGGTQKKCSREESKKPAKMQDK